MSCSMIQTHLDFLQEINNPGANRLELFFQNNKRGTTFIQNTRVYVPDKYRGDQEGGGGNDINFLEIVSAFPWIFFLAAMSDILYAGKVAP